MHFWFQMRGHSKGEVHLHAAAVMLEWSVEETLHLGKGHNFVELAIHFGFAHAENRAAHINVFATGLLQVKASADLEQAAHAAVNFGVAFGGASDARKDFQQGAFARAVAPDEADD